MRKRTLGVVLVAGLAISGSSAFTGSNTLPASSSAGYGETTVTGGEVLSISYTHNEVDQTISEATFVAKGNWTTSTSAASIQFLDNASPAVQLAAWKCTTSTVIDLIVTDTTFTCTGTTKPKVAAVATTGITLTK